MRPLLLLLVLAVQADAGEAFVRFHKGHTWKFRSTIRQGEQKHQLKITYEVIEADDSRIRIKGTTVQELDTLESSSEDKFEWALRDGFVAWMSVGEKPTVINVLKPGAKVGDTWKSRGYMNEDATARFVGVGEIKVPAGTYPDAHQTELKGSAQGKGEKLEDFTYRVYLVPKVGVVKLEWTFSDWSMVTELVESKEPK